MALPPSEELRFTTDPDRVIELAPQHGRGSGREAVELALAGRSREEVVVAIAREADRLQQRDRVRVERYKVAGAAYAHAFQEQNLGSLPLAEAHTRVRDLAARLLPRSVT